MLDPVTDFVQVASGRLRYSLGNKPWPAAMFVIGTGRSGTNWVGEILARHPDVAASIERPRFFRLSREMALNPMAQQKWFARLVRLYRYEIARVAPRRFADKSHTNIWIADRLAQELPDAMFVGVRRGVYATVASMLKHGGVQRWAETWQHYPLPNAFLGIGAEEGDWYETLSPTARSALRWVAHEKRFGELRQLLGSRLVEVQYEQLHLAPAEQLRAVERAVGLSSPIPAPRSNPSSLDRWRTELTQEQISEIDAIVASKLQR